MHPLCNSNVTVYELICEHDCFACYVMDCRRFQIGATVCMEVPARSCAPSHTCELRITLCPSLSIQCIIYSLLSMSHCANSRKSLFTPSSFMINELPVHGLSSRHVRTSNEQLPLCLKRCCLQPPSSGSGTGNSEWQSCPCLPTTTTQASSE